MEEERRKNLLEQFYRKRISREELLTAVEEDGLDEIFVVAFDVPWISDYCAIVKKTDSGQYRELVTGERGITIYNDTYKSAEEAYYHLLFDMRSIKKHRMEAVTKCKEKLKRTTNPSDKKKSNKNPFKSIISKLRSHQE